jgi:hypothetical protein
VFQDRYQRGFRDMDGVLGKLFRRGDVEQRARMRSHPPSMARLTGEAMSVHRSIRTLLTMGK